MGKIRKKIYLVTLEEIDPFDEFEVEANNLKHAKQIARRQAWAEGMRVVSVEEQPK